MRAHCRAEGTLFYKPETSKYFEGLIGHLERRGSHAALAVKLEDDNLRP